MLQLHDAHESELYEAYDAMSWDPNKVYGSDVMWSPITPSTHAGPELYLEFSVRTIAVETPAVVPHSPDPLHGCGGRNGVAMMVQTVGMPAIARHRIVLGLVILIGVYAVMLLEIWHRAVVGLIGASLVCGLLGLIGTPPTFNTVIDWMDEGT